MRKIFLIVTFLCSFFMYAQNSIKGNVEYTISINTANKKEIPETDNNKKVIEIIKNARDVIAYLNFTEKESLFEVKKALVSDLEKGINLTRIFAGKDNVFYYNIVTNERLFQKDFMGELFLITKQPIEWEIKQESKQIGNYTCFKAIKKDSIAKNKKIIAWFTPQIPVSYGPNEFNSLPGLILEVNHPVINFRAIKVEINPKILKKIIKPTKGKKVTDAEYKEITKKAGEGIFGKN